MTLDLKTPDSNGYVPDTKLIGTLWKHYKNMKTYKITGFVWGGESDRWYIQHQDVDPKGNPHMLFVRTPESFFAKPYTVPVDGRTSVRVPRFDSNQHASENVDVLWETFRHSEQHDVLLPGDRDKIKVRLIMPGFDSGWIPNQFPVVNDVEGNTYVRVSPGNLPKLGDGVFVYKIGVTRKPLQVFPMTHPLNCDSYGNILTENNAPAL